MPKELEQKLKRQVAKKNWSKKRKNAYIYGTLRRVGWIPSHQKKPYTNALNKKLR